MAETAHQSESDFDPEGKGSQGRAVRQAGRHNPICVLEGDSGWREEDGLEAWGQSE